MDLKEYGVIPALPPLCEGEVARVSAVHKERYALVCDRGECYGRLKSGVFYNGGAEPFPTTGDYVLIRYNSSGDSQIFKTLPRTSFFSRRDPTPGRGEQAVAANFDYVFLIQSLNSNFNLKRLERYLTLAWQSGATPVIVLTKADLQPDCAPQIRAAEGIAPGVGIHAVSAKTGMGLEALNQYLKPHSTVVFLGSSGVGKSSLLNALAGEQLMEVQDIREEDERGRHTTTHRQLLRLPSGVLVIDTPGMRELGMWDVSSGLGGAFTDVEQYLGRCKFSDCRHQSEPGCAILEALESGALSQARWNSYLALKSEAQYTDDKSSYLRRKQTKHKKLAKQIRQKKKQGEIQE